MTKAPEYLCIRRDKSFIVVTCSLESSLPPSFSLSREPCLCSKNQLCNDLFVIVTVTLPGTVTSILFALREDLPYFVSIGLSYLPIARLEIELNHTLIEKMVECDTRN